MSTKDSTASLANRQARQHKNEGVGGEYTATACIEGVEPTVTVANATPPKRRSGRTAIDSGADTLGLDNEQGRTEVANAKRLVYLHGEDIHYCADWKTWHIWDGKRWDRDNRLKIDSMAKTVSKHVWQGIGDVAGTVGESELKTLVAFGKASSSAKGVESLIRLARSEKGIAIVPDDVDREPWLFNCDNGTLDLKTGRLGKHEREPILTKLSPVAYDPAAKCPLWESVLDRIMAGKSDLISFLQRAFGYSLTGDVSEDAMFLLYGTGANGKTTVVNVLMDVLGTGYAMQAEKDLLIQKKHKSHPTEIADLHGMRLVATIETDDGQRLAESLVKQLTGRDAIRARRMKQDFWQFLPTHKLFMATNHKPIIAGTDDGIWRRMRLVPFTVRIPDAERDKELGSKLKAEYPGILAWLVRGCMEWQRIGLAEPDEVKVATKDYRDEMDTVANFVSERCTTGRLEKVRAGQLYTEYESWCAASENTPLTLKRFGNSIRAKNFVCDKSNGVWYLGLGILEDNPPECDPFDE